MVWNWVNKLATILIHEKHIWHAYSSVQSSRTDYCQTRCLPILVHPWQNVYHWMLLSPVWLVVYIFYYFILASAWLTTVQFGLLNVNLNCLYIAHYSSYYYTFWWCHLYSVAKLICPYLISSCVGQYIKITTVWKWMGLVLFPGTFPHNCDVLSGGNIQSLSSPLMWLLTNLFRVQHLELWLNW